MAALPASLSLLGGTGLTAAEGGLGATAAAAGPASGMSLLGGTGLAAGEGALGATTGAAPTLLESGMMGTLQGLGTMPEGWSTLPSPGWLQQGATWLQNNPWAAQMGQQTSQDIQNMLKPKPAQPLEFGGIPPTPAPAAEIPDRMTMLRAFGVMG